MKQLFTSLSILFLFISAASAHTGSIRGTIYGNGHRPLEGVSIYFKPGGQGATTDAFGKFFLKGVEPGTYAVVVSHVGYESRNEEITIEDGVTSELSLTLLPAMIKMNEVSVNARKDLAPGAIRESGLHLRPVENTQDLFRLVPGLFIAQHQGGGKAEQVFLRGFDCDHGTDINVSVDNMPVNMVSHAHGQGFADAHFIIPESIQELDYGKGSYLADKGNLCTAGYIAMKTKTSLDNSFVKVDAGMFDYYRTAAGISLFNRSRSDSKQDAYIIGEYTSNRSYFDMSQHFNRFNIMGKYTGYIAADKTLSLTLSGFNSAWDASGQVPGRAVAQHIAGRYGSLDPEAGTTSRYNANLQYYQAIGTHAYIKSNVFFTWYTFGLYSNFTFFASDSVNGDQVRQAESRTVSGFNHEYANHYTAFGLKMKTQVGTGLRHDRITDDELTHTAGKNTVLERLALGDILETDIFGYAQQSVTLLPQLTITAGVRYDQLIQQYENKLPADNKLSRAENGRLSPKAGIYYNLSGNARLYYSYGTGFHSNDTRTMALGLQRGSNFVVSNTVPRSFSHDLGFVARPTRKLLLSAAVWLLDLEQEYGYSGDGAVIDTSGRTRRYGLDCSAGFELLSWLYLDADVNYAHGRFVNEPAGNNYIPLAPAITSTGGATARFNKKMSAGLRFRYMGSRPANNDNSLTASGYTIFDAVASYTLPHYEFGVQVQNLFNTQWNEAQFATETRLRYANGMLEPGSQTDVCSTPGIPFFIKLSAAYKF